MITPGVVSTHADEPVVVDFRRPRRVANERMRALDVMHERMVKSLEGWLLSRVRGQIELRLTDVRQASFAEFAGTLESPCCAYLVDIKDCGGQQGVVDFGLDLSYFLIDRLFGGHGDPTILDRALSPIERMALRVVAERVVQQLQECWHDRVPLSMELSGFESVPEIIQSSGRQNSVLHIKIGVMFAGKQGNISISLPQIALEAFFAGTADERKSGGTSIGSAEELTANRDLAEAQVRATYVSVRAMLPDFRIQMRDLSTVHVGMVLQTGIDVNAPIQAFVGSTPRFRCIAGRVGNKLAVRVQDFMDANDAGIPTTPVQ
ncbi:MAG: flagellar motor switch protein FliM [Gemmatimonadetes bacterium]|nr:flagellar motor switch protein FliM [Gemmatimonadota bacterium]